MKTYKDDPSTNAVFELSEVLDTQFNAADPIKLLVILALRMGAVAETSWEQLVANLRARSEPQNDLGYAP